MPSISPSIRVIALAGFLALPACDVLGQDPVDAGPTECTGPKFPDSDGTTYPLSPISIDCSAEPCASSAICIPQVFAKSAGQNMGCRIANPEAVCDDQADDNRDGFTDCNDCTCCVQAACAGFAGCTCDILPARISLQRYGNYEGLPACVGYANGYIDLVQIGCAFYASFQGLAVVQPSVGPIFPVRDGPHRYKLGWVHDFDAGGVRVIDRIVVEVDTEAGTVVGSFERNEGGHQRPRCGFAAPKGADQP